VLTMRRHRPGLPAPEWGRRKLLAVLAAACVGAVAVIVGLGLAVYYSVIASRDDDRAGPPASNDTDRRTPVTDRALGDADEASRPGPLTAKPFSEILLPTPVSLGPVGVSTGFPPTPQGALAQLAAIDQRVLQSASVSTAQEVISKWAMPGGPTPESWSGVHAVAALLGAAGVTGNASTALTVSASPEMGLIKGTVGSDDAVVCVDFVVTATMTKTASVAAADCQRMVWTEGRWMIGAGPEPAQVPSVWPGTEAALEAGFKVLRNE